MSESIQYNSKTVNVLIGAASQEEYLSSLATRVAKNGRLVPQLGWREAGWATAANVRVSRAIEKGRVAELKAPDVDARYVAGHLVSKYGEELENNPSVDTMLRFWSDEKRENRRFLADRTPGLVDAFQSDLVRAMLMEGRLDPQTLFSSEHTRKPGDIQPVNDRFRELAYGELQDMIGFDFKQTGVANWRGELFNAAIQISVGTHKQDVERVVEGFKKIDEIIKGLDQEFQAGTRELKMGLLAHIGKELARSLKDDPGKQGTLLGYANWSGLDTRTWQPLPRNRVAEPNRATPPPQSKGPSLIDLRKEALRANGLVDSADDE